ncbi:Tat pathway signal sequence domain protein [Streptomyces sp. NPDC058256]|uniref:Tat pathway signal sequence domain protein n=1 Tax=Streptomyces sp. NPDC058256 TaxID=3346408 RepID=UPI0036EDB9F6
MSGIGPVEPGEGTHARDTADPETPRAPEAPRGPLMQLYARHRRAALAAGMSAAVLVVGGYLYATRPRQPPAPAPPYPSQVTEVVYAGKEGPSPNHPRGAFAFAVELTVSSGPPVTVLRIEQPSAGFFLTSDPHPPFRTRAGFPHRITLTVHVNECAKVPRNAGFPFLDVTLRNTHAIQVHSFILGELYAQDLSEALQVACGNNSPSSPKP